MLPNFSPIITITFVALCLLVFFYFAKIVLSPLLDSGKKRLAYSVLGAMILWVVVQSVVAGSGFYIASFELPPRALLVLGPPLVVMLVLFSFYWRRDYFLKVSLESLTYIHVFRLPLEWFVLSSLFLSGYLSEVMTYHGRNFDILVGISAPIVAYLVFSRKSLSWKSLLVWNIVSLLFLINVTTHAVLSMPYPDFQQFGFNQPNVAVFYFPFILLPVILVQVAYFCHIASIIQILRIRD